MSISSVCNGTLNRLVEPTYVVQIFIQLTRREDYQRAEEWATDNLPFLHEGLMAEERRGFRVAECHLESFLNRVADPDRFFHAESLSDFLREQSLQTFYSEACKVISIWELGDKEIALSKLDRLVADMGFRRRVRKCMKEYQKDDEKKELLRLFGKLHHLVEDLSVRK